MTESPERPEIAENSVVDDRLIMKMMRAFYARVRVEPRIGDFWSAVMSRSGRYQGQPMRLHLPQPIDAQHFDRWLELFDATAREVCSAAVAEQFMQRARTIGRSQEMGIAAANGVMLPPGERY